MGNYRVLRNIRIIFALGFFTVVSSVAMADSKYLVQKGDTLYSISRKFQITVPELRTANNLSDSDVLKAGQKLVIPSADISNAASLSGTKAETKVESKTETKTEPKASSGVLTHTVQKGDTLYGLAKKYDVKLAELLSYNSMDSSSTIKIGQIIRIPGKNAGTNSSALVVQTPSKTDSKTTSVAAKPKEEKKTESKPSVVVKESPKETSSVQDKNVIWPLENPSVKNISGKVSGVLLTGKDNEAVKVVREGTVMFTGLYRGFGQVVFIQSKTGLIYSYSGLDSVNISKGDYMIAGSEIGTTGKGKESSIKFMVFQNGKPVDPSKAPRG